MIRYIENIVFNINIPGGAKKRPEHLHALFSRMVKMNQHKSIYVIIKHQRICVGIFVYNTSVLAVIQTK